MSGSLVLENADFRVPMGWHPVDRSLGWARWALLPSDCPFLQMPHSRRSRQAAGRSREVAGGTLLSPGLGGGHWRGRGGLWTQKPAGLPTSSEARGSSAC